jgi:ribosomal protein S18 acetylase RimI-like enzyme
LVTIAAELLQAADRNRMSTFRSVLATAPTPGDVSDDEVALLSSGLPVPLFNPAFVHRTDDPGALVARVVDHYRALEVQFLISFRDEVAPGLADACAAAGLVEHWRPALMVLDPIASSVPSLPSELRVSRVTEASVDDYAEVLSAGFGMPREIADALLGPWLFKGTESAGFIGTINNEPMGSAALFVSDGVAGIYNIATVPQSRGKGVGTAMTWAAIDAAHKAGATCAVLQASEQGEPIYDAMGFVTPTRYRQFQQP